MENSSAKPRLSLHWQILIGLIIGATCGLIARQVWPEQSPRERLGKVFGAMSKKELTPAEFADAFAKLKPAPVANVTLDAAASRGWLSQPASELFQQWDVNRDGKLQKSELPLSPREWLSHNIADTFGQVFLRLILMVVVPLVFSALTLGVAGIGDVRRLGRLGVRTLVMTLLLSSMSVAIGLTAANLVKPGEGLPKEKRTDLQETYADDIDTALSQAGKAKSPRESLLDIIPKNPLQEMVGALDGSSPGGGMLAVMFFALACGVAISISPERTAPLVKVLEGVYDIAMVVIGWAMRLAPIGVAGFMFKLTATLGLDILQILIWYVGTVVAALALHMFGVYSLVVWLFARLTPRQFFGRITEVLLTAFATSSSNATLPTSLRVAEEKLGIKREIANFVLTVGSTANQNGTALYEGITVLFLAQVFGVNLTIAQQVQVVLMSILAGVGTAGVPGGSLPLVVLVLKSVGVPEQGIGIILGVDRLLDMCRTTLNVTGDLAVAVCVDRGEKIVER
ncbi:MAG: dicarboxylate/amino acid:cation symporter [Planctomycetaceae bacterium]